MPSPKPTGHRRAPAYEKLGLNVDPKINGFVNAVREHIEGRVDGILAASSNKSASNQKAIRALTELVEAQDKRITDLEAQLSSVISPSEDDKHALTKAKLIQFMKSKGWY